MSNIEDTIRRIGELGMWTRLHKSAESPLHPRTEDNGKLHALLFFIARDFGYELAKPGTRDILNDCADYFDDRADVEDDGNCQPVPNAEMRMVTRIDEVLP